MEEVGHEQEAVCLIQQLSSGPFGSEQLEQGVELHELQAGLGKDFQRGTLRNAFSIIPLVRGSR